MFEYATSRCRRCPVRPAPGQVFSQGSSKRSHSINWPRLQVVNWKAARFSTSTSKQDISGRGQAMVKYGVG